MILSTPMPFAEAIDRHERRQPMPTHLSSAQLQQIDAGILRSSLFSARNYLVDYLAGLKASIRRLIDPVTVRDPERVTADNPEGWTTRGRNDADLRVELRQLLKESGYSAAPGERGTIRDFASDARLNLVIRTNAEIAQGYGYWAQGQDPDVLDAFPAQELYRAGSPRGRARDWEERWRAAATVSGDTDALRILGANGRMVARKDSPIWQSLGDGAGLADAGDALHNPYPPFAFNSLMDIRDVSREDAIALELIRPDERVEPQSQDFPVPTGTQLA